MSCTSPVQNRWDFYFLFEWSNFIWFSLEDSTFWVNVSKNTRAAPNHSLPGWIAPFREVTLNLNRAAPVMMPHETITCPRPSTSARISLVGGRRMKSAVCCHWGRELLVASARHLWCYSIGSACPTGEKGEVPLPQRHKPALGFDPRSPCCIPVC